MSASDDDSIIQLPVLRQSRDRLLESARSGQKMTAAVTAAESDPALAIAVLRLANRGPRRGAVASVAEAVRELGPPRLAALAESLDTLDLLDPRRTEALPESLRLHSLVVHQAAGRLTRVVGGPESEELVLTAALLHDVGKLGLEVPAASSSNGHVTPEARVEEERRACGRDHAAVGAAMLDDAGVAPALTKAVAGHHDPDADGPAAVVQLADLLAHYAKGAIVDLDRVVAVSARLGISQTELSTLMYELPYPITAPRPSVDPCPLSDKELRVLACLGEGLVYKQIAEQLGLSPSTIRSHTHRIYTRIGAADRTQAVIYARERGWI